MQPIEPEELNRTDGFVSLVGACHGVLSLLSYEYPQYLVFPKEEKMKRPC